MNPEYPIIKKQIRKNNTFQPNEGDIWHTLRAGRNDKIKNNSNNNNNT